MRNFKRTIVALVVFALVAAACNDGTTTTTAPETTTTTSTSTMPTTTTTTSTTTTTTTTTTTIPPEPEGCYVGPRTYVDVGWMGEQSLINNLTGSAITETICVQLIGWSKEPLGPGDRLSYITQLVVTRGEGEDVVVPFLVGSVDGMGSIVGVNTIHHPFYHASGVGGGFQTIGRNVPAFNLVEEHFQVGEYYIIELDYVIPTDTGNLDDPYYRIWEASTVYNAELLKALRSDGEVVQPKEGASASIFIVVLGYNEADWPSS